jgi:hypothetical protein
LSGTRVRLRFDDVEESSDELGDCCRVKTSAGQICHLPECEDGSSLRLTANRSKTCAVEVAQKQMSEAILMSPGLRAYHPQVWLTCTPCDTKLLPRCLATQEPCDFQRAAATSREEFEKVNYYRFLLSKHAPICACVGRSLVRHYVERWISECASLHCDAQSDATLHESQAVIFTPSHSRLSGALTCCASTSCNGGKKRMKR